MLTLGTASDYAIFIAATGKTFTDIYLNVSIANYTSGKWTIIVKQLEYLFVYPLKLYQKYCIRLIKYKSGFYKKRTSRPRKRTARFNDFRLF